MWCGTIRGKLWRLPALHFGVGCRALKALSEIAREARKLKKGNERQRTTKRTNPKTSKVERPGYTTPLVTRLWKPKLPSQRPWRSANSTTITRSSKRTRRATQLWSRKHAPFFQVSAHRIQSHQGPTSFVNFASMTLHGYSAARASMPSLLISRRKVERRRVYDL